MKQNLKLKKGFTLIELLVVIAIIGILAAITVVSVQGPRNKAQDTKRLTDVRQTASLLEQYYGDYAMYNTGAAISTWGALTSLLAPVYGQNMPSGSYLHASIGASATTYCISADALEQAGTQAGHIVCRQGAVCDSLATLSTAGC